jgi:hypothetical protein
VGTEENRNRDGRVQPMKKIGPACAVLVVLAACLLASVAPADATQRMVLAEMFTNTG